MEFAISQPKWSDCHEMKSKRIDRTLGLKCDHRGWPWPWPWPWIFKVKHGICYISAKNDPIATERKSNISTELKASNVTIGFDLGHDLDLKFSRSNIEFAISQPKTRCACLLDSGGTIWLLWVSGDPVGIKIDSVGTSRRKWPAVINNVVFLAWFHENNEMAFPNLYPIEWCMYHFASTHTNT